jgi:hypothetical protein
MSGAAFSAGVVDVMPDPSRCAPGCCGADEQIRVLQFQVLWRSVVCAAGRIKP